MFRADQKHSGTYSSPAINSPPTLKWKFKTGGPIASSAIIDRGKIYFGSNDSNFYCLDANSGNLVWKYKTGGPIPCSPAISNPTVYFLSYDGTCYALNAGNGKVRWTFKTDGEKKFSARGIHGNEPRDMMMEDNWDTYLSSPSISEGLLYIGSGSGYCYALETGTGKLKWKFRTNGVAHSSPAVAFGNVYIGSWDTYLYALDKKTGAEKWKFKTGIDTIYHNQTGIQSSPLIDDSTLYFGCRDSRLYALNAVTGELRWKKFNRGSWVIVSPVVYGDKLIYLTSDSRKVIALNKLTGDSIYQSDVKAYIFSSPAIADETLYFGGFNGIIAAIDVNSGRKKWGYEVDGSKQDMYQLLNPDSSLNDRKVFISAKYEDEVKGIAMLNSLGAILASPVIDNGVLYLGTCDGNFYALE